MIIQWLKSFKDRINYNTLVLNNNIIPKNECEIIGGGSEKQVCKIKGTNQCFLFPNKITDDEVWKLTIQLEKLYLDQIISLGLRAQQFEIVSLEIQDPGKPSYTIPVLLTMDFASLCQEQGLTICDDKAYPQVTGIDIDIFAIKNKLKNRAYAGQFISTIAREYAVAVTFSLPINILKSLDDSQHFVFEQSQVADEPPKVRYMFWDVVSDFDGLSLPIVPTLSNLKVDEHASTSFTRLGRLANGIACAMLTATRNTVSADDQFSFVQEIEACLKPALNDDVMLNQAINHARNLGVREFKALIQGNKLLRMGNFEQLFRSAISLGDVKLLEAVFALKPNIATMSFAQIDELMEFAKRYNFAPVTEHLTTHLLLEKRKLESDDLKQVFFEKYSEKLTADGSAWCGLYSFFATSNVDKTMTVSALIEHAQGRSKKGSGKRSLEVMQQLGWLDDQMNVQTDQLRSAISMNL